MTFIKGLRSFWWKWFAAIKIAGKRTFSMQKAYTIIVQGLDAKELTFTITQLVDWEGPWEFKVPLE